MNNLPHGLLTASKPPIPAEAAALLAYLRDELHCRATLEDGRLMIRPAHQCPPRVLAAVIAVQAEVVALIVGRAVAVVSEPSAAAVEALARTMLEAMNRNPGCRITDPDTAMRYYLNMARNRLIAGRKRVQEARDV